MELQLPVYYTDVPFTHAADRALASTPGFDSNGRLILICACEFATHLLPTGKSVFTYCDQFISALWCSIGKLVTPELQQRLLLIRWQISFRETGWSATITWRTRSKPLHAFSRTCLPVLRG